MSNIKKSHSLVMDEVLKKLDMMTFKHNKVNINVAYCLKLLKNIFYK